MCESPLSPLQKQIQARRCYLQRHSGHEPWNWTIGIVKKILCDFEPIKGLPCHYYKWSRVRRGIGCHIYNSDPVRQKVPSCSVLMVDKKPTRCRPQSQRSHWALFWRGGRGMGGGRRGVLEQRTRFLWECYPLGGRKWLDWVTPETAGKDPHPLLPLYLYKSFCLQSLFSLFYFCRHWDQRTSYLVSHCCYFRTRTIPLLIN